jgi:hypothetical protein
MPACGFEEKLESHRQHNRPPFAQYDAHQRDVTQRAGWWSQSKSFRTMRYTHHGEDRSRRHNPYNERSAAVDDYEWPHDDGHNIGHDGVLHA